MRSSILTGSLLLSVAAVLVLPALSQRPLPGRAVAATPRAASAPAPAVEAPRVGRDIADAADLIRRSQWEAALVRLATADAEAPLDAARKELLASVALLRVGDPEAAEGRARLAMRHAADGPRALAVRAAFAAAEAREDGGDTATAAELYASGVDGPPALAAQARTRAAEMLATTDPARARGLLEPLLTSDARPETLALAARCALAAGDEPSAVTLLMRLHLDHPASAAAREAAGLPQLRDASRRALQEGRAADVRRRAEALVEADQARLAWPDVELLLAAAEAAGTHDAELELLAGRALRALGQPAKALPHLNRAAAADGPVACRGAFHASRAQRSLRRSGDAARALRAAAMGCGCEWRDRAALELAESESDAGRHDAAREWWRRVAADSPSEEARRKAAWKAAWSLHEHGRPGALAAFESLAAASPASREAAAARYWAARLVRAEGRGDEADERLVALATDFPRDWYGLLAARETGREIPPPPACGEDDAAAELARLAFEVTGGDAAAATDLLEIEALGLVEEALAEADAAPGPAAARAGFRALALSRAGRSREALREFRRHAPDWRRRTDVAPALACAAWPLDHADLLLRHARASGLPPSLVFALVHQESVFDAKAVSHAGARGLMQVMPATGRTIARWLGESVTTARLLEPETNVRYGTTYLKRLLDESGRAEVALAGYNAGPGRARAWLARAPPGDIATFVETIPFDETRDYVKAIAVNERIYAARLGGAPATAAGQ